MRDRQKRAAARHGPEAEQIVRRMQTIQSRSGHNLARIWDDWISAMALAISNGVDRRTAVWAAREAEYMGLVERHGRDVMVAFAEMMGMLVEALDGDAPTDVLGGVYMGLELGNDHAGQFFTPSDLCALMSDMTMDDDAIREIVDTDGWVSVQEPAIGGGAMVIPMVARVRAAGFDPARHMHVTGVDVDWTVLRMAYVQLSLLGVPAVLYVGNTLTMEMREAWYTPAHVFGGWGPRLRGEDRHPFVRVIEQVREAVEMVCEPAPVASAPAQVSLFDGI